MLRPLQRRHTCFPINHTRLSFSSTFIYCFCRHFLIIFCHSFWFTFCGVFLMFFFFCCFVFLFTQSHTNTHISILTQPATSTSQQNATAASSLAPATPTQSVSVDSEAPKSPPKWPLRPGVMVHVKDDTKEQLQQVRTQSPTRPPPPLNKSIATSSTTTTPKKSEATTPTTPNAPVNPFRVSPRCTSNSLNETTKTSSSSNADEQLVKFSNSKLLQRILQKLKLRRTNVKEISDEGEDEDIEAADGSSFKRRNDYRFRIQSKATWRSNWDTWAWFGSNKSTRSNKTLVDNNNHIKGLECTEKCKLQASHNFTIESKTPVRCKDNICVRCFYLSVLINSWMSERKHTVCI